MKKSWVTAWNLCDTMEGPNRGCEWHVSKVHIQREGAGSSQQRKVMMTMRADRRAIRDDAVRKSTLFW